jgi:hypothetical protein
MKTGCRIMTPVICPNCGRSTPEGRFCEHCGAALPALPAYVPPPAPPAPAAKKRSALSTILIILGAIVLLFIVFGFIGALVMYTTYPGSSTGKSTYTVQPTAVLTSVPTPVPVTTAPTYVSSQASSYRSWHPGTTSTVQIQNGHYRNYWFDMKKGDMKKISVATDGSPIDLMVMDSSNFKIYDNLQQNPNVKGTWQAWNRLSIINDEYILTAPADDTYYFVLDNTDNPSGGANAKKNVNVAVAFSSYY